MARKEKRINISLSDEMLERLDYYAGMFGIPRASLCTMLIGQGVVSLDTSRQITDSVVQQLSDRMGDEMRKKLLMRVTGVEN